MSTVTDEFEEASDLYAALATQERRVLGLLLTHPRLSAPFVDGAGLDVRHFGEEDHRLIFSGWWVAREAGLSQLAILRLIRRALRDAGLWNPAAQRDELGMWHSDATLAVMASVALNADDYLDSMHAVGWDGDWLGYAIARHVSSLVSAVDLIGASA